MIDITTLTEADKGREVVYTNTGGEREYGRISSWSDHFIFVRYGDQQGSQATSPSNLEYTQK